VSAAVGRRRAQSQHLIAGVDRTRGGPPDAVLVFQLHDSPDAGLPCVTNVEARLTSLWERPHTWRGWLATVDHKDIGCRYIVTAAIFLFIGGVEALIIRTQLALPNGHVLTPEAYDQIFSLHGITMIFWYASPILSGFGNYLIPLLAGSRDMAFPRLNAFSYWTFLFSGVFLYVSPWLGQAPNGGWFAYVPYTNQVYSPGLNMDFYAIALLLLTVSTTVGAVNFIVTILQLRAPGMTITRMPLVMYSTLTVSVSVLFALPGLTAACLMLEADRRWGTHFFDTSRGGSVILWQQLFWFFGHPWVYIIFLPATGMVSMLLPVFARRPIVGYTYVALATVLTGLVGFGVWVHHMFAIGMTEMAMSVFSAASMTISVFSAIQVFAWIATLWHGRPVRTTSLWFALGFLAIFVIGGLSGIVTAVVPFDWQVHDTYFVVAHLHYVLIGANLFPVLAALYYWMPKITGWRLNERIGLWSFWLVFIGFNVTFFPMHFNGLFGMPRRVWTYGAGLGWTGLNLTETVGAYVMAAGLLLTWWNVVMVHRYGERSDANPWRADTLEWDMPSPPPVYGTDRIPLVASRHPLWDDWDEREDPFDERRLDHVRGTLSTSPLTAEVVGVAKMPEDTSTPLFLALALTLVSAAMLFELLWLALAGVLLSLWAVAAWLWPEPERVA
jgi:cytochrome c oxidase subunit I